MAQITVITIAWRRNSPFGGYTTGDVVNVLYDTSTSAIVVKENGSVITSGNSIPVAFNYSGRPASYYKTETYNNAVICSGTTRIELDRDISVFPYASIKSYPNNPSCSVSPVVCDLEFNTLPIVVNESTSGAGDGEITVSASSSNGSIEYRLGNDFIYGSGSASGTFSGLTAGNYRIFARDAANCKAYIAVSVAVENTYGTKYRIEYDDYLGFVTRLDIKERDYSSSVTEVKGTSNPVIIRTRQEGQEDKFVPVIGTEVEIGMISESNYQFLDLFTGDPKKYQVLYQKDFGSGFVELLTTKLLPNQYVEEYKAPPYEVKFICTDGLKSIESIPFLDANGNRFVGSYSVIKLLAYCLRNTGLNLNIRVAANIYADGMDTTDADDPLEQAYIDSDRYYLEDKTPNCLDVIKYLLEPFGAQLIQWNNVWNIVRVEEKVEAYDYREFDENGDYVSNSSFDPLVDQDCNSVTGVVWTASPTLEMNPGYGKIKLDYQLGLRDNVIKNGDFKLQSIFNPVINLNFLEPNITGFQVVPNGDDGVTLGYQVVEQDKVKSQQTFGVGQVLVDKNNIAIELFDATGLAYIKSKSVNVILGAADRLKFTIKCGVPEFTIEFPYIKIRCIVHYGSYYLTGNGTWSDDPTEIIYYNKEVGKYVEFSTTCVNVPDGADAGMDLNIIVYHAYAYHAETDSLTAQRAIQTGPPVAITAGGFDVGNKYIIVSIGTTNFTLIGAASNTVGLEFTATGAGSGTGTAIGAVILGIGHRTERVDAVAFDLFYYELENNTSAESVPNIVRPNDYHATSNPVQWILKTTRDTSFEVSDSFFIDKVDIDYFFNGSIPPEKFEDDINAEANNPVIFTKTLLHGSLREDVQTVTRLIPIFSFNPNQYANIEYVDLTIQNTADIYTGYFRDSTGVGFEDWTRDYFAEELPLDEIIINSYGAQYSSAWRRLRGAVTSKSVYFTPLNTIREVNDDNRKYYPVSVEINDKEAITSGEFLELTDIVADTPQVGVGFSEGFSLGFNS